MAIPGSQAVPAVESASWRTRLFASHKRTEQLKQLTILLILIVGAIAMIVPFEWMLATSFSRSANTAMPRTLQLWPPDASWFNYEIAVTNLPIVRMYINSFIVATVTTAGYLFLSALTGYAFAKGTFPGKSVLFIVILLTLMIPFEIRMLPLYRMMTAWNLRNTLAALILPFLAGGFGVFLMRQYITTIPNELLDAARVDGANEFTIFLRIVLPLCGPPLAALTVLSVLWRWNDLIWPLLVTSDRNLYTITLGLAVAGRSQSTLPGVALANASISILPIIVVFLFLQRYIIRGIALSGLKG